MKPVLFHEEAEAEFEAAVAYDEERQPGLGMDFQAEVEASVWSIRADPLIRPVDVNTGARKCLLKRFPYSLFYVDLVDAIGLVAVAHQKRKPGYWKHRQPGS